MLFSHLPWPEGTTPGQVFEDTTEQIRYAEDLGFASAWLAEHHFSRYGLGSSQLILAARIAGQTKRIRFGTAVLVPPLHHPIRLAEDIAMLDQVSGGRVEIGFGRGSSGYEYAGYSVSHAESQARFQETIKIVEGLWTTPDFSYEGQFYSFQHVNLVPPPLQQPHPPLYIAATRTPTTLDFVARSGHPIIVGVVLDHADALDRCRRFITLAGEAGNVMSMARIPFFRYLYVAESAEQARQDTRAAMEWTQDMIQWRGTFSSGSEAYQRLDDFRRTRTAPPTSYEHIAEHRAFFGTPDEIVSQIQALQDEGLEHFGCNFAFGNMPHDKVMRSMALFAKEVMPQFHSAATPTEAAAQAAR
jgi:alkanesulfonate monooxygenase SsuD/methylene tetrahydromethanopterin reductase-like flavin-dependent oxidoreductase (luciferase family)